MGYTFEEHSTGQSVSEVSGGTATVSKVDGEGNLVATLRFSHEVKVGACVTIVENYHGGNCTFVPLTLGTVPVQQG
jgi:hypothetical protein